MTPSFVIILLRDATYYSNIALDSIWRWIKDRYRHEKPPNKKRGGDTQSLRLYRLPSREIHPPDMVSLQPLVLRSTYSRCFFSTQQKHRMFSQNRYKDDSRLNNNASKPSGTFLASPFSLLQHDSGKISFSLTPNTQVTDLRYFAVSSYHLMLVQWPKQRLGEEKHTVYVRPHFSEALSRSTVEGRCDRRPSTSLFDVEAHLSGPF